MFVVLGITKNINVEYVFDTSDKLTTKQLDALKDLARASLMSYNISPLGTRVSVLSFSSQLVSYLNFTGDQTLKAAQKAVNNIAKINGNADFDELAKYISSSTFGNLPDSSEKVIILFTQGNSIDKNQLKNIKEKLPNIKTTVVSIGDNDDIFGSFDNKIVKDSDRDIPDALDDLEKSVARSGKFNLELQLCFCPVCRPFGQTGCGVFIFLLKLIIDFYEAFGLDKV